MFRNQKKGMKMETSLAFTIIAVALTLLGLFKFIAPKKFNENSMGELYIKKQLILLQQFDQLLEEWF